MLHGSSTEEQAQKEIEYFFPMEQTVAVIKPDAYQTKGTLQYDPLHKKTCLRGFQPGPVQTKLYSHRILLVA